MENFVLININTGNYIGVDKASGGYPYETDNLGSAKIWYNKQKAKEYAAMFPDKNVSLYELKVSNNPCEW